MRHTQYCVAKAKRPRQKVSAFSEDPCRRHGSKETALFLYCGVEKVSPVIDMRRKPVI